MNMSSFNPEFRNLKACAEENRLEQISVSSVVEICQSYAASQDSIDKTVEVINFFFTTRNLSDRMLLAQALSLLQACLPRVRTFVTETLKNPTTEEFPRALEKILHIIDMLQTTATFFDRKFNWTSHHLTLRDFYMDILSILMAIFLFVRKRSDPMMEKLMRKVSELYLFILEKLSSADISYFLVSSPSEREFLSQVLGILFLIGEVTPSIDPSLWATTWKNTHKIISSHSEELKRDTRGSIECLEAPIKFICQQIREGIRDAVKRNSLGDTQKILKITKFYLSILTKLIELFPEDYLPHTNMILENLFYLQSVRYLKRRESAEEVHKIITDDYMKNISFLQRNKQFIECLVNTHYTHDSEIYAFLVISTETLRIIGQEGGLDPGKSLLIEKILALVPNCNSVLLDYPAIFQELCKNVSLILIANPGELYRRIFIKFIHKTLKNPSLFGPLLMLSVWRNIQTASREDIRFETFVMWKNTLERVPRITVTVEMLLMQELLRISFDCLSTESQHRVVSLNNPQENYFLWSILSLERIPSADKRNFLTQKLAEKAEKSMSEFLERKFTVKSFENMILILRTLGNSSFTPEENFKRKYLELWRFIDGKSSEGVSEILNVLLEMFRRVHSSLSHEDVQEILRILKKLPCIEMIECLKIIAEKDEEIYWAIQRDCRKSSEALKLLASFTQKAIGRTEPEASTSPPNKRFKEDFGAESEAKLRKILQDVDNFQRNRPPGQPLPLQSVLLVRKIISALRKVTS